PVASRARLACTRRRGLNAPHGIAVPGVVRSVRPARKDGMPVISTVAPPASLAERVDQLAWSELRASLDDRGFAVTEPLLSAAECVELAALFDGGRFRSTIDMARHRFGDGRYRYFDHPLPETIAALRSAFYRRLAPVANDWAELLRGEVAT